MFGAFARKLKTLFTAVGKAARQRGEKKLAAAAEMERRERKALVQALAKKLEAARADCEQKDQTAIAVVLSVKEIQFIEWNLNAWARHLKASEIYMASPQT